MAWSRFTAKAIVHIDGDAFFASCEQAIHPEYRGKPLITGQERGIVAAASYEAKRYGIKRGVPLWEVKKLCPEIIIVPSDYETYSIFSQRLFECMRRFTPTVEEYGIDEGFADITGLRGPLHQSYGQITATMKKTIQDELGISVSAGLATSKALAKLGSKWQKPNGCTIILPDAITSYLQQIPVEKIWGIGHNTAQYLQRYGLHTAHDFARQSETWIRHHCVKPLQELWQELNGNSVWPVQPDAKVSYQSISKTKTFSPPSKNPSYVFAQLSKNIENACIKARRYNLGTLKLVIFLKTQSFRYASLELRFNRRTAFPAELINLTKQHFSQLYQTNTLYRATGTILPDLAPLEHIQMNLFEAPLRLEKMQRVYASVDQLAKRYGKHTVKQASSLNIAAHYDARVAERKVAQQANTQRQTTHQRQFVGLPMLNMQLS
ncbi:MAG: hypothetical protein ACD_43C00088G0005 [uncultured bacterium]|nr:MAG: hypothetical protein ACD_43C00088G0005 [uncultured bacterium]